MNFRMRPARSAPCPCGSGKRFKHCHGKVQLHNKPLGGGIDLVQVLRDHEAKEVLRKRQQGHGRPVVSVVHNGYRFVAVGRRLAYSRDWRFFPDFLLWNMKEVMGREWGRDASKLIPDHPIMNWLRLLQQEIETRGPGNAIPMVGWASALNRFCYALYLLEHNDKPPKSLIKRLQKPSEFHPACYEALVASAFALAGAKIDAVEDIKTLTGPKPEFLAKFSEGTPYSVEAKRKKDWRAEINVSSDEFRSELKQWIRGKLHAASKKLLANPVYWFELGIGKTLTEREALQLQDTIGQTIADAETLTVNGRLAPPAYVVITNNPEFSNDQSNEVSQFALLQGFRMEDFRDQLVETEEAMDRHDKHLPIVRVLECLQEVQQVPTNFEGVPDELLDALGNPITLPKIGEIVHYQREQPEERVGVIEEAIAAGDEAVLIVIDKADAVRSIIRMPLAEQEAKAAKVLGNAVFGKPEGPQKSATDPMQLYDQMLQIYGKYDRSALLTRVKDHPMISAYSQLPLKELQKRVAREITKAILASAN